MLGAKSPVFRDIELLRGGWVKPPKLSNTRDFVILLLQLYRVDIDFDNQPA